MMQTGILPLFANPVTQQLNYKEMVNTYLLAMFPGFTSQLYSFAKSENQKKAHFCSAGIIICNLLGCSLISCWTAIQVSPTAV